jgi:hypothetical protein
MLSTIILLVEQLVIALGTEFRVYLPQIIPHILRIFLQDTSPGRTVTAKVSVDFKVVVLLYWRCKFIFLTVADDLMRVCV